MTDLPNPKLDDHPPTNTEKDPDNWVSGDDPMTGAQASYLTTLAEEAGEAPPPEAEQGGASKRIDAVRDGLDLDRSAPRRRTGDSRPAAGARGALGGGE